MTTKDCFDELLSLEDQLIDKGKEEGVNAGKQAGLMEGTDLGIQKGTAIGREIGFYSGCVMMWAQLASKHPDMFSQRANKTIAKLTSLLLACSLDPQSEKLLTYLDDVRSTYRLACSQLGIQYKHEAQTNF